MMKKSMVPNFVFTPTDPAQLIHFPSPETFARESCFFRLKLANFYLKAFEKRLATDDFTLKKKH